MGKRRRARIDASSHLDLATLKSSTNMITNFLEGNLSTSEVSSEESVNEAI